MDFRVRVQVAALLTIAAVQQKQLKAKTGEMDMRMKVITEFQEILILLTRGWEHIETLGGAEPHY